MQLDVRHACYTARLGPFPIIPSFWLLGESSGETPVCESADAGGDSGMAEVALSTDQEAT